MRKKIILHQEKKNMTCVIKSFIKVALGFERRKLQGIDPNPRVGAGNESMGRELGGRNIWKELRER